MAWTRAKRTILYKFVLYGRGTHTIQAEPDPLFQVDNVEISLQFCHIHNALRIYLSGIGPQMRDLTLRWLASYLSMGIRASPAK